MVALASFRSHLNVTSSCFLATLIMISFDINCLCINRTPWIPTTEHHPLPPTMLHLRLHLSKAQWSSTSKEIKATTEPHVQIAERTLRRSREEQLDVLQLSGACASAFSLEYSGWWPSSSTVSWMSKWFALSAQPSSRRSQLISADILNLIWSKTAPSLPYWKFMLLKL